MIQLVQTDKTPVAVGPYLQAVAANVLSFCQECYHSMQKPVKWWERQLPSRLSRL